MICCEQLADVFNSTLFNSTTCSVEGCTGSEENTNGRDVECTTLLDPQSVERTSCEIGRDFRFIGLGSFDNDAVNTFICEETGILLPAEQPDLIELDLSGFETCDQCCSETNSNFDTPDDLAIQTCMVTNLFCHLSFDCD